jgi:hypothetical protein
MADFASITAAPWRIADSDGKEFLFSVLTNGDWGQLCLVLKRLRIAEASNDDTLTPEAKEKALDEIRDSIITRRQAVNLARYHTIGNELAILASLNHRHPEVTLEQVRSMVIGHNVIDELLDYICDIKKNE